MADTDINAIIELITSDWRGKVRTASVQLRAFENDIRRMNTVKGVQVRMVHRDAAKFLSAASEINREVREGVDKELQVMMIRSLAATPIRTGALRNSAQTHKARHEGGAVTGSVSYGGEGSVDYALYVHEDVTASHAPPTQAKFLETAAIETSKDMDSRMADRIQRYLRSL